MAVNNRNLTYFEIERQKKKRRDNIKKWSLLATRYIVPTIVVILILIPM